MNILNILKISLFFQLVDQFYRLWEERNLQTNNASAKAVSNTGSLMDQISHITNLQFLQNELTAIVKDNIDTVMSVCSINPTTFLIMIFRSHNLFGL